MVDQASSIWWGVGGVKPKISRFTSQNCFAKLVGKISRVWKTRVPDPEFLWSWDENLEISKISRNPKSRVLGVMGRAGTFPKKTDLLTTSYCPLRRFFYKNHTTVNFLRSVFVVLVKLNTATVAFSTSFRHRSITVNCY